MTESGDLLHGSPDRNPLRIAPELLDAISPDTKLTPVEREMAGMLIGIGYVERKGSDPTKPGFDASDIFAINKKVVNDSLNPHLYGALRKATISVASTIHGEYRVAAFTPVHPKDLPALFEKFSQELQVRTEAVNASMPVGEIIDLAAWAHTELIRLHPFNDGNGRTARALVDLIFRRANLMYITDWGVADDEYKDAVDRTYREGNPDLFKDFLAGKVFAMTEELEGKHPEIAEVLSQTRASAVEYRQRLNVNGASAI